MEDAHHASDLLPPPGTAHPASWPPLSFYAVYDGHAHGHTQCTPRAVAPSLGALLTPCTVCGTGHGGAEASAFCRAHLHRHLLTHIATAIEGRTGAPAPPPRASADSSPAADSSAAADGPTVGELADALAASFTSADESFLSSTDFSAVRVERPPSCPPLASRVWNGPPPALPSSHGCGTPPPGPSSGSTGVDRDRRARHARARHRGQRRRLARLPIPRREGAESPPARPQAL